MCCSSTRCSRVGSFATVHSSGWLQFTNGRNNAFCPWSPVAVSCTDPCEARPLGPGGLWLSVFLLLNSAWFCTCGFSSPISGKQSSFFCALCLFYWDDFPCELCCTLLVFGFSAFPPSRFVTLLKNWFTISCRCSTRFWCCSCCCWWSCFHFLLFQLQLALLPEFFLGYDPYDWGSDL